MTAAAPGAGLAVLYAGLTAARNRAFDHGWLPVARLGAAVISIGNLAMGGTGKTPTVIALGRALGRMDAKAALGPNAQAGPPLPGGRASPRLDVLTRGYRRSGSGLQVLAPGQPELGAEAGDEPRLIARALGVPVLIGADRAACGREGERRFGSQLHLLDDGFQRRQLARCFDLVLVTPEDLADRPLPAGRLREPLRALARAQAILWVEASPDRTAARRVLARWTGAPVYFGCKQPVVAPEQIRRPRRPVFAFCGLGRPESFWQTLEAIGARVAGRRSFRDHHRYQPADLERLRREARAAGAEGFVTTEKDALNLPRDPGLSPLEVIAIEMRIEGQERLVAAMLEAAGLGPENAAQKH